MFKTKLFFLSLALVAVVSFQSCVKDALVEPAQDLTQTSTTETQITDLGLSPDQLQHHEDKLGQLQPIDVSGQVRTRAAVNYLAQLCSTPLAATHQTVGSISNADFWDYYYFEGEAGDTVTIFVPRTSIDMDPAYSLFFGTTTSTTGVTTGNGGPDMTFLVFADDQIDDIFGGCFGEPYAEIVLPSTGTYTLAVYDFISCGPLLEYEIQTTGIVCDADGDGCEDFEDPHPNSNQDPTVVIDGCDSGVANQYATSCSTMNDLIADAAAAASNHGQFVSAVAALTNAWKDAGLISGREKSWIQTCAAQSNLP